MANMNAAETLSRLYVEKDTLSTRVDFHGKYSVNPYGWGNWVFDQYGFGESAKVVELACGTAAMWQGKGARLPANVQIVLSDISPLMVEKAKALHGGDSRFTFEQIDIQEIPYENDTFDFVIANHMLYHVPDLEKALSEVRRVLKPDGGFYATTVGEDSLRELKAVYRQLSEKTAFSYTENLAFTLQNGAGLLDNYFSRVEKRAYMDALQVTDADDLMSYVLSYNDVPEAVQSELMTLLRQGFSEDGVFHIRKEQGIFVCQK